jgi:16S rRNA (guanine527-N7)-methyltransferase
MSVDAKSDGRPQGNWRIKKALPGANAQILSRLEDYYGNILKYNSALDLIPRRTEIDADLNHIVDCVLGGEVVLANTKAQVIFDIGSGNGMPGIIMSLLDPKRNFVLIDSNDRKVEFLKTMATRLGLTNVTAQKARVEDLKPSSVECAVSRGIGNISKSILAARKTLKVGGEYFHFKAGGWVREVSEIPSQLCAFWAPRLVAEYELPIISARMAIVCTKRTA